MSDIGMPAGFNLFVISLAVAALCGGLILVLLLVNLFVQRGQNFARRLPFRLLIGMLLPLAISLLTAFLLNELPLETRQALDRINELYYLSIYAFTLLSGFFLGKRL